MRKSLGGSYGGGDGEDILRTLGSSIARAKLNNIQESLPSNYSNPSSPSISSSSSSTKLQNSTSKHALSISSNGGLAVSANWGSNSLIGDDVMDDYGENNSGITELEWKCLENYYDPVFGVVPSTHEVQQALCSIHQVLHPESTYKDAKELTSDVDGDTDGDQTTNPTVERTSSKGSDSDWMEPSMQPYDRNLVQSPRWERVHDAFHLLETEPSVQRMVVSLSSDKAVWNAVLNNKDVREIRDSYRNAESLPPSSYEKPDPSKTNLNILKWVFNDMKMKLLEFLGNISQFIADIFTPLDYDKEQYFAFSDKLKSSFLLTVVVLLIVVVARGHRG
ncbi:uncharacterized protein LOC130801777 isoform X2 [Amaranthus tricolor]|uniref:uncharacterized protein LOC130801777 isoform X2 n=1 Tax=Amaranthus tricolor TaxID=29722 RepID=UPI0025868FB9|nr:uncharacterized protein LOC130801777 isoform X2 [Amaranthus tricolor]